MKKVLVDATPLIRHKIDGVSRYAKTLLDHLDGVDLELLGFIDDKIPEAYAGNFRKLPIPRRLYSLLNKTIGLPAVGAREAVHICLNFFEFPKTRAKKIVFIHDLAYLTEADAVQARNRWALRKLVPRSIARASQVATISQASAAQIAKTYKLEQSDIAVIYPGVDTKHFKPIKDSIDLHDRYKLPPKYILFFGTLEPRKNISGIVEAYAKLPTELQRQYGLVLGGSFGWTGQAVHQRIEELKGQGLTIVTTGYIEHDDQPALYSAASLFVLPSFEEGFGIPILEAMACGTPVVVSDIPVLHEVAGSVGRYADPDKPADIAKQMAAVLKDEKLANEMAKQGLDHVKQFSWQASADKLKAIIDKL